MSAVERALEDVESAAWAQQYAGLDGELRGLAVSLGQLQVFGVGAWPDSPWHHVVTGLTDADDPSLGAALALLTKLGAARPVVQVAGPPPASLASLGFTDGFDLVRMSAPTVAREPHPKVRAIDGAAGSTVASVCLKGFGQVDQRWWRAGLDREGWTQVVAHDGDVAVGTGALFVDGSEAWIGSATTVPEARRRGVHAAMLATRLGLAHAQGAARVSVKCVRGSTSYRGLVRAGFTESHPVTQWRRSG